MGACGAFLNSNPRLMLIAIGATMATTLLGFGISTATILLRRTPAEREAAKAMAGTRNFVWQLQMARWSGGIRSMLGDDRALALNRGAGAYLRAKEALGNPAWKSVAPDTEFAATRNRTETALEVAMARLVTVIGQGQNSQSPEVLHLLRDMTETADEATRAAEKLSRDSGRPGDASENLRQVLSEMRLLNSAQDEIDQLRDRSR